MDTNLADFYLTRLSNIAAETVILDVSQVISVIGVERTEEISQFIITMKTDLMGRKKKARSAIPQHKRISTQGLGRFNREQLLTEIRKALITPPQPRQLVPGPAFGPVHKLVPNPPAQSEFDFSPTPQSTAPTPTTPTPTQSRSPNHSPAPEKTQ